MTEELLKELTERVRLLEVANSDLESRVEDLELELQEKGVIDMPEYFNDGLDLKPESTQTRYPK